MLRLKHVPVVSVLCMMAQSISSTSGQDNIICKRLHGVKGENEKVNDVIYCRNSMNSVKRHVIFFGGDVQDYKENMESHRDNVRYVEWNLEETGKILVKRFPDSSIFIIKPTEMFLKTFSIYSNFAEFSENGVPIHRQDYGGLLHLYHLYKNAVSVTETNTLDKSSKTIGQSDETGSCNKDGCSDKISLTLIGFSKGCVVLNQILYELKLSEENEQIKIFLSNIESMYWLDGGHNGSKTTWVTDTDILQRLSQFGYKIFAHITPYQVDDPMRAWIGKEEQKFVSKLRKFGAKITQIKHFADQPASIENHFRVLLEF